MTNEKFQDIVLKQLQSLTEVQGQLVSGIGSLNHKTARIEERIGALDLKTDHIEERIGVLDLKTDRINSHLESLDNKTDRLDAGLIRLESCVENEVTNKVRALFDARQAQEDKIDQVIERLDSIEIDTGYLVSRVSRLENLAK